MPSAALALRFVGAGSFGFGGGLFGLGTGCWRPDDRLRSGPIEQDEAHKEDTDCEVLTRREAGIAQIGAEAVIRKSTYDAAGRNLADCIHKAIEALSENRIAPGVQHHAIREVIEVVSKGSQEIQTKSDRCVEHANQTDDHPPAWLLAVCPEHEREDDQQGVKELVEAEVKAYDTISILVAQKEICGLAGMIIGHGASQPAKDPPHDQRLEHNLGDVEPRFSFIAVVTHQAHHCPEESAKRADSTPQLEKDQWALFYDALGKIEDDRDPVGADETRDDRPGYGVPDLLQVDLLFFRPFLGKPASHQDTDGDKDPERLQFQGAKEMETRYFEIWNHDGNV